MKPFNIELAKQGKPICLKNGRKARIICFDVKGIAYPIVALVEEDGHESVIYYNEKGKTGSYPSDYDLMMAPESKVIDTYGLNNPDIEYYKIEKVKE